MAKKKLIKGLWSKGEVSLLKKLFPNNPTVKVAARLGRSSDTVKKKASRMGLKKSKKYLKSLGRA
jgi:transcriptional regulator of aromatic amino acid metabolism